MSIGVGILSRLKNIENLVLCKDTDKWRYNTVYIEYRGTDEDINNNKKYYLDYDNKKLVYDDIQDFYNEYDLKPKQDINPIIIEIVDNSYLERYLYDDNL